MLTNEWTFIKIRAAEFELHKLCALVLRHSQTPQIQRGIAWYMYINKALDNAKVVF
jgi:hypothetical protein